jgi:hypothetical protein
VSDPNPETPDKATSSHSRGRQQDTATDSRDRHRGTTTENTPAPTPQLRRRQTRGPHSSRSRDTTTTFTATTINLHRPATTRSATAQTRVPCSLVSLRASTTITTTTFTTTTINLHRPATTRFATVQRRCPSRPSRRLVALFPIPGLIFQGIVPACLFPPVHTQGVKSTDKQWFMIHMQRPTLGIRRSTSDSREIHGRVSPRAEQGSPHADPGSHRHCPTSTWLERNQQ